MKGNREQAKTGRLAMEGSWLLEEATPLWRHVQEDVSPLASAVLFELPYLKIDASASGHNDRVACGDSENGS